MSFCPRCGLPREVAFGEACTCHVKTEPEPEPDVVLGVIKAADPRGALELRLDHLQGPPFVVAGGRLLREDIDYQSMGPPFQEGGGLQFMDALIAPAADPAPVLVIDYGNDGMLRVATYIPKRVAKLKPA